MEIVPAVIEIQVLQRVEAYAAADLQYFVPCIQVQLVPSEQCDRHSFERKAELRFGPRIDHDAVAVEREPGILPEQFLLFIQDHPVKGAHVLRCRPVFVDLRIHPVDRIALVFIPVRDIAEGERPVHAFERLSCGAIPQSGQI